MKTMNRLLSMALAAGCVTAAQAGGVFGSITVDGQLAREGTQIELVCGGQVLGSARTDRRGSYQMGVDQQARGCAVRVEGASTQVVVYANPTRYDFALTHGAGGPQLARR